MGSGRCGDTETEVKGRKKAEDCLDCNGSLALATRFDSITVKIPPAPIFKGGRGDLNRCE